jgi:hypothetical protein
MSETDVLLKLLCHVYTRAFARTVVCVELDDDGSLQYVPMGDLLPMVWKLEQQGMIRIADEGVSRVSLTLTYRGLREAEDALSENDPDGEAAQRRSWRMDALRGLHETLGDDTSEDTSWASLVKRHAIPTKEATGILGYWLHFGSVDDTRQRDEGPYVRLTARGVHEARWIKDHPDATLAELGAQFVLPTAVLSSTIPDEDATREACVFRRSGGGWEISYEGESSSYGDLKGLAYLHMLIGQPRKPLHVFDLIAAIDNVAPEGSLSPGVSAAVAAEEMSEGHLADAGEIMDDKYIDSIKKAVSEMQERIERAKLSDEVKLEERLENEKEQLVDMYRRSLNLEGETRTAGDPSEKARKMVSRAIHYALDKIREHNPALWTHLHKHKSIRLGFKPVYEPAKLMIWVLE